MPRIRRPRKLRLYNALKIGYLNNPAKQSKRLKAFGLVYDKELSTSRHLVAYNPNTKKVVYIVRGTDPTSPYDVITDVAGVGLHRLENTYRYQQDYSAYLKAKEKYNAPVTIIGHSLGGALGSEIVKPEDRAITYNPANIYQKSKPNVYNYRTVGDPFSALSRDTKTLPNPETSIASRLNPIQPHNVSNIRDAPIFV